MSRLGVKFSAAFLFLAGSLLAAGAKEEQVLFAFDNHCLPFQQGLRLKLIGFSTAGRTVANRVLAPGPPRTPDSRGLHYYGSVAEVNGELWMWYLGLGDLDNTFNPLHRTHVCFARSSDGRHWVKPSLGLIEYGGNRNNNLVDLGGAKYPVVECVVLYEPDDPDPGRRFKMVFETPHYKSQRLKPTAVAWSGDGVRWTESPHNPVGPWCEPSGIVKWRGAYYLSAHASSHWTRMLDSYISYDFEHWLGAMAVGFHRGPLPFEQKGLYGPVEGEQVHLGASLWNRGNVIIGFYGQWHGSASGDRRLVPIDLGLVVSHDALHYFEPIADFRIVQAKEISAQLPFAWYPTAAQGQGFVNRGDETLFWYSAVNELMDGVRLAHWERDRLGYLSPWEEADRLPSYVVSEPIAAQAKPVGVYLNTSGLGQYNHLKVSVLDEHFNEVPEFGAADCTGPTASGLRQPVTWAKQDRLARTEPFRIRVDFGGIRPADLKLYAIYVTPGS